MAVREARSDSSLGIIYSGTEPRQLQRSFSRNNQTEGRVKTVCTSPLFSNSTRCLGSYNRPVLILPLPAHLIRIGVAVTLFGNQAARLNNSSIPPNSTMMAARMSEHRV